MKRAIVSTIAHNKAILATVAIAAAAYVVVSLMARAQPISNSNLARTSVPIPTSSASPLAERRLVRSIDARGGARRTYALPLSELAGLPVTAVPGLSFDLWVTWDDSVAESPTVQRLLKGVVLVEIVPPVTPEAPAVAIISVRRGQTSSLLYGDNFGRLSVAMVPS